nr:hypothetical protein [White spot syndrome virus]
MRVKTPVRKWLLVGSIRSLLFQKWLSRNQIPETSITISGTVISGKSYNFLDLVQ